MTDLKTAFRNLVDTFENYQQVTKGKVKETWRNTTIEEAQKDWGKYGPKPMTLDDLEKCHKTEEELIKSLNNYFDIYLKQKLTL